MVSDQNSKIKNEMDNQSRLLNRQDSEFVNIKWRNIKVG
jgi:hypothetical protein